MKDKTDHYQIVCNESWYISCNPITNYPIAINYISINPFSIDPSSTNPISTNLNLFNSFNKFYINQFNVIVSQSYHYSINSMSIISILIKIKAYKLNPCRLKGMIPELTHSWLHSEASMDIGKFNDEGKHYLPSLEFLYKTLHPYWSPPWWELSCRSLLFPSHTPSVHVPPSYHGTHDDHIHDSRIHDHGNLTIKLKTTLYFLRYVLTMSMFADLHLLAVFILKPSDLEESFSLCFARLLKLQPT